MTYVTSIERLAKAEGRAEGLIEGLQKGVVLALGTKFSQAGKRLAARVKRTQDLRVLLALEQALEAGQSLAEIRKILG